MGSGRVSSRVTALTWLFLGLGDFSKVRRLGRMRRRLFCYQMKPCSHAQSRQSAVAQPVSVSRTTKTDATPSAECALLGGWRSSGPRQIHFSADTVHSPASSIFSTLSPLRNLGVANTPIGWDGPPSQPRNTRKLKGRSVRWRPGTRRRPEWISQKTSWLPCTYFLIQIPARPEHRDFAVIHTNCCMASSDSQANAPRTPL